MTRQTLKKKLKQHILSLMVYSKSYKLLKPFFSGIGHILMFHRVCPKSNRPRIPFNTSIEVTPQYLENAINFFKDRDYEFISLDRMYRDFQENKFHKKFVVVTFDDGYLDNLTHALPVLKKHNFPFTIYVSTNFPEGTAVLWWDLLEDLILERDTLEIQTGDKRCQFNCSSMVEKEDTYSRVRSIIIGFNEKEFSDKIREMFSGAVEDVYRKTAELALSWDQVIALDKDPLVTIGAHTVNHFALKPLPRDLVQYEVLESKRKIEAYIGHPVEHFAYPFGGPAEVGTKDLEIVKKNGFKTAVATVHGNIFPGHKHYLEFLPRIHMKEDVDNLQLELSIHGFNHFKLHKFKRIITV